MPIWNDCYAPPSSTRRDLKPGPFERGRTAAPHQSTPWTGNQERAGSTSESEATAWSSISIRIVERPISSSIIVRWLEVRH
jgi:hypothetical protein